MHPPFHCVRQRSFDRERTQTFVRARATALSPTASTAARHRTMRLPRSFACAALVALCLPASARAQRSDSLLAPFTMEHRAADASSLDLSFLLDAPAGKHGFVRVRDGHLVRGDGARLRLWGVHLTDWSRGSVLLPPKEDAPMWASTLARYGINCVRLHFLDLDAPRGIIAAGHRQPALRSRSSSTGWTSSWPS